MFVAAQIRRAIRTETGFFVLGFSTSIVELDDPSGKAERQNRSRPKRDSRSEATLPGLLFHEPWWLAAATNGHYEEAVVRNNDRVVARLPYVVVKRVGFTTLRMPRFTHLLGPIMDVGTGKPQTQLLRRLSLVRELIDQLPRFDFFKQAIDSSVADGLAFQDRGFRVAPQYTFEIDCRRDPTEIWDAMSFKTRQHIKRAEEKLIVNSVSDPHRFIHFYQENLDKLGYPNNMKFDTFPELFAQAKVRDSGEIICAQWPNGRPAAMVFLVWGHGTMYYLMSTRVYDPGDNGSVNLLLWSAINRAHQRKLLFDLDGVSTSGNARFLSGFGGRIKTRMIVQRSGFFYNFLSSHFLFGRASQTKAFT